MENMFYYEDIKKNYFENRWSSLTRGFMNRHKLSYLSTLVLLFAYDGIYEKYGKLIPTNDKYDSVQINPMGIMFAKEIDDNYLKEVEELFKDNYEFNFYDFLHYSNIGKIDILEIKNKYPNLKPSTIRDITLYAKDNNVRNILFAYLNDKDYIVQDKVCQLIKPISIEVTKEKELGMLCDIYRKMQIYCPHRDKFTNFGYEEINSKYCNRDEFVKFKLDLFNNKEIKKEDLDKTYININTNDNVYFINEFEYLFQDILIGMLDKINYQTIDILLKIKEYALNNIPLVTGDFIVREKYHTYIIPGVYYGEDNHYGLNSADEIHYIFDGFDKESTIDYSMKDVLNKKKAIISLLPMLLDNKFDYQELIKYDNYEYIQNLIELVNNKEKRLCK